MKNIPYVPIDYDDSVNIKEVSNKTSPKDELRERREQRAALERDILQLQKQLVIEVNMRNALHRGFNRPPGSLPRIYGDLPAETRNLLLEVAVLEEEIVSLEKQVIHLGREIETEVKPELEETIWKSPEQNTSPKKAEIVVSPSVGPRDSSRINSKTSLSPRKSIDQKNIPSKPSFSAGKVLENRSSYITVSVPAPRNSLDDGNSIKSSISPKDSSESRRISTLVPPQKPHIQRNSSFPKVSLMNTKNLKNRKLSPTKKEPLEPTGAMHTVPFIPIKHSPPKEDEGSTPPESPAPVSSSDVGKGYSQAPKIKPENGKPPITGNSKFSKKDLINIQAASKTYTTKARGTPRPGGQDKGSLDTSRIPRQPLTQDTILTRRTMSPLRDLKLGLEQATDSDLSSEEVVELLKIICGHLQEKQPPLASDSSSSSQASISTNLSTASADNFEMRGGVNMNFRLDDCYPQSFGIKRSAKLKYMRDCYAGEVADALDPYTYLKRETISKIGFHQRLMS